MDQSQKEARGTATETRQELWKRGKQLVPSKQRHRRRRCHHHSIIVVLRNPFGSATANFDKTLHGNPTIRGRSGSAARRVMRDNIVTRGARTNSAARITSTAWNRITGRSGWKSSGRGGFTQRLRGFVRSMQNRAHVSLCLQGS